MIKCEKCIKSDVCGVKNKIAEHLESLNVNYATQQLKILGIDIDMNCKYFLGESQPKIFGGER